MTLARKLILFLSAFMDLDDSSEYKCFFEYFINHHKHKYISTGEQMVILFKDKSIIAFEGVRGRKTMAIIVNEEQIPKYMALFKDIEANEPDIKINSIGSVEEIHVQH